MAKWIVDWEAKRVARDRRAPGRDRRQAGARRARRPVHAPRPRRPHRPPPRRPGRDARLQDRHAALGAAGAARLRAAARRSRRRWCGAAPSARPSPAGASRACSGSRSARSSAASRSATRSRRDWTADQVAEVALRPLHRADRRLRPAGARLCLARPADVRDALREPLRSPRPRPRMGAGRERGGTRCGSARRDSSHRRRDAEGAGRRLEPARLGLGVGQCRLGQDLRARLSRHPPAARRRRSRRASSA